MDWASHIRRILTRLGEDATYTHAGGGGVTVRGIFISPYQSIAFGDHVEVAGANPRFAAMSSDLALVARNDTIQRGAVTYKVAEVQPEDPAGLTVLELQV